MLENRVSGLTDEYKKHLKVKHLEASPMFEALLLKGLVKEVNEIIFDDVTEVLIQEISARTKGAAGP